MKTIKITSIITLLLAALCFSGCNTMEGAGKDIEKGGQNLQDAAK
ncbi:entericidin A/B family lipoprotein [Rariglobus hedericola]|uniref:Entericidin A/B family lipoprotein n=1 Tax=Rariglobus hedericola TaxID=2597822 RepID=A0A556QKM7_9BACT|nr:entericidin A/B family lipoprotein [Rariglobus hedericola]TSJ77196.1 entericidin A/B family lipoprotein [Rariglobus hedericola]